MTAMKRIGLFVCILLIFTGRVHAQSPEDIFDQGNQAYCAGDYEKAVSFYEQLIKMDRVSPEVFYNLGNGYFKLKKTGKAILNYERALKMSPRDKDVYLNLKLAKGMAVDKIDVPEKGFILNILFLLYEKVHVNELIAMSSIIFLAVILFLIFSIYFVDKRKLFIYNAISLGVILAVLLIFLTVKIQNEYRVKSAIIIIDKADVRSGPREDYILQFSLHEGTKVRIVKELQNWYEISLSQDMKGWIPKSTVEVI